MRNFSLRLRTRGAMWSAGRLLAIVVCGAPVIEVMTSPQAVSADLSTDIVPAPRVAVRPMSELKISATISVGKVADWVAITSEGVWVGTKNPNAVKHIDPNTYQVMGVDLPGEACAGLAADSKSLWVPLCGRVPKLAKVDLKTRTLAQVFDVGPAAPEGGIAIGAGSIWLITDKHGSLARIDPTSGAILQTVHVPPGSYNPVFSDGRIWVTRFEGAEATSVDAATGQVLGHFPTGPHPRFLTAGAGAVWAVSQGDGSLSRIDIAGQQPVLTLQLHIPGFGGDITYADGRIWTTMMKTPLTIVDAARSVVLCQWKGAGGDALGVGFGAVWLTNLEVGTVSRIALDDLPQDCRPARPDK